MTHIEPVRSSACAALCLLAAGVANASPITVGSFSPGATTLDFEDLVGGVAVTNQYSSHGVAFYGYQNQDADGDPMSPSSGVTALTNTNLTNLRCDPSSSCSADIGPFRVIATQTLFGFNYGSNNGTVGVVFVDPTSGNLATTNSVGAYVFTHSSGIGDGYVQLTVFDANSDILETLRLSESGNVFFGIHRDEGIARAEFSTGFEDLSRQGHGFNVDDLVFEQLTDTGLPVPPLTSTNVPVPAAAWLLGTSLLGLLGMMRRKPTAD